MPETRKPFDASMLSIPGEAHVLVAPPSTGRIVAGVCLTGTVYRAGLADLSETWNGDLCCGRCVIRILYVGTATEKLKGRTMGLKLDAI